MEKKRSSTPALVWGILGLVFCWVPIIGIVFSAIGIGQAKKFVAANGVYDGKSKTGKVLAIIGLVFSIIFTIIEIIVLVGGGLAYYYY